MLGAIALATSGCQDETGGLRGELNAGTFFYRCAERSDAQCDADAVVAQADDTTAAFPAIAVGAVFGLRFDDRDGTVGATGFEPATPKFLAVSADALTAMLPGIVGVVFVDNGRAVDFVHLNLVAPASVSISQASTIEVSVDDIAAGNDIVADGSDVAIDLTSPVSVSSRTFLRAVPRSEDGRILAGGLTTEWTTSDPTIIEITSDPSDNVIAIETRGTGTATLTVTQGDITAAVTIDAEVGS